MPTNIPYLNVPGRTGEVWQPVTGCSPCSPGCLNCYAAVQASHVYVRDHRRYVGLAVDGKWTGEVRCNEQDLTQPLRWRKPRVVGVCFMGDLFHPDVPDAFLDKVFAVMYRAKQHTFVLCTKRAERMREYLSSSELDSRIALAGDCFPDGYTALGGMYVPELPLANVHLGVTTESDAQIDRAKILADTPAAHRWLSVEPMLGGLKLPSTFHCWRCFGWGKTWDGITDHDCDLCGCTTVENPGFGIDGIIIGCESGPHRRRCDLAWVRQVVEDCKAAGVLCYVKQLDIDGRVVTDTAKFPKDLRVRQLAWDKKGGA